MATTTAFILAGKEHPNDGGINPYHCIQLTEGNAPCYTMRAWVEDDLIYEGSAGDPTRVIIPTLENPLEDLILMIMVFAVKDMADFRMNNEEIVYMDNINPEKRKMLYAESQKLASKTAIKLVVSIITSDSLLSMEQLAKLNDIGIEHQILN